MRLWIIAALLATLSLHALNEQPADQKEVVEVEPGKAPSQEEPMKRRWTKRTKPGAPKARKASPSRKKVVTLDGEEKMISMEDDESDEEGDYTGDGPFSFPDSTP